MFYKVVASLALIKTLISKSETFLLAVLLSKRAV